MLLFINSYFKLQITSQYKQIKVGGARRDRTDDLLRARQALSQLSYGPGDFLC